MFNTSISKNVYRKGDFEITLINEDLSLLVDTVRKYIDLSHVDKQYTANGSAAMYHYPESHVNDNKVPIDVLISKAPQKEQYAVAVRFTPKTRTGEAALIEIAEALDIGVTLDVDYDFSDLASVNEEQTI